MHVTLINPNIVSQKDDFSGSGIPYLPIGLAHLAAYLRERGHAVHVIDAFGLAPDRIRTSRTHVVQGLTADETVDRIPAETEALGFYAHLTVTHRALLDIIRAAKARHSGLPTFVLENGNIVNSYSLRQVAPDFFSLGVDHIVLGYPERRTERLLNALRDAQGVPEIAGVLSRARGGRFDPPDDDKKNTGLDGLPFPAWDLFPLENYWRLGYAHAPFTTRRYLALLTSRGCPFNCGFCISPEVSGRRWHARSAENVAAEMQFMKERFGVREFHFEDINPTLDRRRMVRLSRILIDRGLDVIWKLAQGTKLESLDMETVAVMARAGCRYVSFSPESGSPRVLQLMGKPVDLSHALRVARWLRKNRVTSQACFVIGYPGEMRADRKQTARLVRRLARVGVDEVALFIITPMPGSRIFRLMGGAERSFDELTFTPTWREDYRRLARYRKAVYLQYALLKLLFHPWRALGYAGAFVTGHFKTKVEMTIYRKLKVLKLRMAGRRTPESGRRA
jgi:anaerobic magnesium-protoporphyrin IX monomethyl ester cyclase